MPTFEGNYPFIPRVRSGLFSLDYALRSTRGDMGLALRAMYEIYGHPNVGKSTLSYYLSGIVSKPGLRISLCDIELLDREYLNSSIGAGNPDAHVKLVDGVDAKGTPIPHEKMLMEMARDLYSNEYGVAVLDSVGMIQPIVEFEEEDAFGQAFMGKRAKLVAQVSRALQTALRTKSTPSAAFVINHVHGILGGKGHTTAGGETLKFACYARIMLWAQETIRLDKDDPNSVLGFVVKGQLEKLRFGARGRQFQFYIIPGFGVHVGASALLDCLEYGLAESKTVVKMDDKSYGYLNRDLFSYAATGKQLKFEPFIERLARYEEELLRIDDEPVAVSQEPEADGEVKVAKKGRKKK